jgi:hypothetical protein
MTSKDWYASLGEAWDMVEWRNNTDQLIADLAACEKERDLGASMLARQCDLARDAEARADLEAVDAQRWYLDCHRAEALLREARDAINLILDDDCEESWMKVRPVLARIEEVVK